MRRESQKCCQPGPGPGGRRPVREGERRRESQQDERRGLGWIRKCSLSSSTSLHGTDFICLDQ